MWTLISINWTAQALTYEQMLVIRNVAAQHLRMQKKWASVNFSHPLCEGELIRKDEGSFGTFGGTFFHADLGTVKGERWTLDFLLPRNSEWIMLDDTSVVISVKPIPGGDFGVKDVAVPTTAARSSVKASH